MLMDKEIKAIWDRIGRDTAWASDVFPALHDINARLQAVEKATLPQPYNPDEAEGGTAGGPQ